MGCGKQKPPARYKKKKPKKKKVSPTETPDHYWPFWRPAVWWTHAFATSASPINRSWTKNTGYIYTSYNIYVTLFHCSRRVSMPTRYVAFRVAILVHMLYKCCMRHPWRAQFGAVRSSLNQLVRIISVYRNTYHGNISTRQWLDNVG